MDAVVVQYLVTGSMGLVMWFLKRTIDANERAIEVLKNDIQNLRDTRLHKDDFKDFKLELRGQFEEVKQAIRDLKPHAN